FIVKPYLRLADLNPDAASTIIDNNPNIRHWYIGGHSMGGGVACSFASRHSSSVKGLFLLGAYCSPKARDYSGPTLVVVSTNDPLEPLNKVQPRIPNQAAIVKIDGANHSSFGDYGSQPFDGKQSVVNINMTETLTQALARFIN